jgi:hypothetical protein
MQVCYILKITLSKKNRIDGGFTSLFYLFDKGKTKKPGQASKLCPGFKFTEQQSYKSCVRVLV